MVLSHADSNSILQSPLGLSRVVTPGARPILRVDKAKGALSFLGSIALWQVREFVFMWSTTRTARTSVMRYIDPLTGKPVRATKYHDPETGEETATGSNEKFARKLATRWEADLNARRNPGPLRHDLAAIP